MTKKEDHDADSRRSQSTAIHQFFLPTIIGMDPGTRHVSNFECTNDIDSKSKCVSKDHISMDAFYLLLNKIRF